ncbi:B-cell receptor-associated protein 31-like [Phoenix dactylifera]|uniref:Endoplasmic reticulum transmembrane protein n=1 Tax=Phoenix dactylifera TaxID=42345 RepID=A0A8B7CZP3_PHODC|nr:B-cell receptor-associated protein 31-like [Phoenix dactylifera]
MIQLLFLVLFAEGAVTLLLMVKIGPLRELVMRGLDQLKTGKGPATVKTLACTLSVLLASSITSILKIQNRGVKLGTVTPMDQVLWRTHLLEASLIGYTLFLGLVIDRLHHYLRKMVSLKKTVGTSKEEVEKLKKEHHYFKDKEDKVSSEIHKLQGEVGSLTEKLQKLKTECEQQEKRAVSAEAHVVSLQKQSEELLLEYDRLLEDNQILQGQLLSYRG